MLSCLKMTRSVMPYEKKPFSFHYQLITSILHTTLSRANFCSYLLCQGNNWILPSFGAIILGSVMKRLAQIILQLISY